MAHHAVQLHKIGTCLAGNGQTAHNDYMLAGLDQIGVDQALANDLHERISSAMHFNAVWPDSPPERELAIHTFGWRVGEDGCARAILRDQARGVARTGKNDNGLDA